MADELKARRQQRERQRLLDELAAHAAAHPEAFDPARLPTTTNAVQAMLGRPPLGRPPTDDLRVQVPFRLPTSTLAALDDARARRGLSRSAAISAAVEQWLARERRRRD